MDELTRLQNPPHLRHHGGPALESKPASPLDHDVAVMTAAEADCWELMGKAAGAYLARAELNPRDREEVASAIHLVRSKLLHRASQRHDHETQDN